MADRRQCPSACLAGDSGRAAGHLLCRPPAHCGSSQRKFNIMVSSLSAAGATERKHASGERHTRRSGLLAERLRPANHSYDRRVSSAGGGCASPRASLLEGCATGTAVKGAINLSLFDSPQRFELFADIEGSSSRSVKGTRVITAFQKVWARQ